MDENTFQRVRPQRESISDAIDLFQALADSSPTMIWMTGTDKLCTFINRRWTQFTGRPMEKDLGEGWTEVVHPDDINHLLRQYEGHFDEGSEFTLKFRLRRHDGDYRWILSNGSPFYLPSGDFAGYIGSCVDVTETEATINELEHQNYLIKTITDNATVGLFLLDRRFRCTFLNAAAENIFGYGLAELRGKSLHEYIHHTHPNGSPFPISECALENSFIHMKITKDFEQVYIRKNGEFFHAICSSSPIINDGNLMGVVLEVRDVSKERAFEKALKRNEARFRALIEKSSDGICLIDKRGNFVYTSPSVQRILGYDPKAITGENGFDYVHPADTNYVMQQLEAVSGGQGESVTAEFRVKHLDGTWRWVEVVGTNLMHDVNVKSIVVNFRDVTERKTAEESANYQYYHDSLTDLPNRNFFTEQISSFLKGPNDDKIMGVILIDLDRFKMINESLGHAIGDRMIQEVSLRLASCLEESDVLARLGGDEYGIILPSVQREEEIGQVCFRILESLKPAFRFDSHELYITPSIGISVHPYDGVDVSSLLKNADSALYRAKELGRNNFQYYSPSMNATTFQQLAMENTLRKALENNEFVVYYQPQIDIQSGRIVQVEALIRWIHPDLGLTFPDEFISIAETTGLIQPIGEWVLQTACEDVKRWERMGHNLCLAVNMSMRQLRQKHLIRTVRKILADSGLEPGRLELELTESILVENSSSIYNTLVQLRKDGIQFAIDDFNTGYSSLNYIKKYPIDILKIDKSFVKGIPTKEKDTAIANAVINLAHSLGMSVVAEGVERPDQLKFLNERNCDKAQGYLFSPPVSGKELADLLEQNPKWEPSGSQGL